MAENNDKEGSRGSQKKIRWDDEMVDKILIISLYVLVSSTKSSWTRLENIPSSSLRRIQSLVGPRFFLSPSKMRAITKQAAALHSNILL